MPVGFLGTGVGAGRSLLKGGRVAGSGEVLLEVDGGVAIVTLNAPDRRNALTPAMADELIATFDEVDAKPEVGALVIRAVGKSFCAGGDIVTLTSAGKDPLADVAGVNLGSAALSKLTRNEERFPVATFRSVAPERGDGSPTMTS